MKELMSNSLSFPASVTSELITLRVLASDIRVRLSLATLAFALLPGIALRPDQEGFAAFLIGDLELISDVSLTTELADRTAGLVVVEISSVFPFGESSLVVALLLTHRKQSFSDLLEPVHMLFRIPQPRGQCEYVAKP